MAAGATRCVIVGGGHAAAQCALGLRKEGWTGAITIAGEEPHPPYHRPPLSKGYAQGALKLEDLWIRPPAVYAREDIELKLNARITAINRKQRALEQEAGPAIPYDRLVLATGSQNRRPPIRGLDRARVLMLRAAADAEAIRRAAETARRAVVVGGGYIGLEIAASLRKRGLQVTVLELEPRILARVTSPDIAAALHELHNGNGVEVHTGIHATEIAEEGAALAVLTRDGARFPADFVVVGTGAKPRAELAERAGLPVDDGIAVDESGRTADPDIFAIGDCANQWHPLYGRAVRLESVQNACDQARTVAAVLSGKPTPPRPLPTFWSDQFDAKLQIAGLSAGHTSVTIRLHPTGRRRLSAWYFSEGRLMAVDALNDAQAYAVACRLIESRAPVDPARLADPATDLKTLLSATQPPEHQHARS